MAATQRTRSPGGARTTRGAVASKASVAPRGGRARRRAITPEDLLCLVGVSEAQMSPDGTGVLLVRKVVGARNRYETSVWIADTTGSRAPRAITKGPKDAMPRWSPDGTRVAFVRAEPGKPPRIMVVAARGGASRELIGMPSGTVRDFAWSPCGRRMAFSFRATPHERTDAGRSEREEHGLSTPPWVIDDVWYRLDGDGYFGAERFGLWVLDIARATVECVYDRDTLGTFSYDWSPDGEALVVAANEDPRASWNHACDLLVVPVGGRGPRRASRVAGLPKGPKSCPRWSPDGLRIAYAGKVGDSAMYGGRNVDLFVHDFAARSTRCLTKGTDLCLMAATLSDSGEPGFDAQVRWFPDGTAVFFRAGWHGSGRIASVPAGGGRVAFHTPEGAECSLGTFSGDGWRLACVRSTPLEPGEAFVLEVERSEFEARRVTGFNDALVGELALVEPEERWVRAADGHRVQCWRMRPRGARGRLPAILEVHGGPHAQYGLTFFHEFQLLCAQGYEVWFSNPRGSKGYGELHTSAIRGAWGTKDWMDVKAVLAAMRRDPGVDRARVGIMGGSYGGYMANWAVAHDRSLRAAITDRCVSNMVSMSLNSDWVDFPGSGWKGSAFTDPSALWRASPIAHFARVRTPMLIIHSEGDLRCNVEQGEQVHAALCTLGVPNRFVRYPRETSHGMSRAGPPDLRIHRLREILAWWERWM